MKRGSLANLRPGTQIVYFLLMVLGSLMLTILITLVVNNILGIELKSLQNLGENLSPKYLNYIRISSLIQDIGLFLPPALIFSYLCDDQEENGLWNPAHNPAILFLLIPVLWICSAPFIEYLGVINQKMVLPKGLENLERSMRESEDQLDKIIKQLIEDKRISILFLNILTIGLITAISEEFFFRGALQKLLIRVLRNPHLGIWLGAIIFSAIHMQFYGFLPRLVLGLILGYLFYWTGSIWAGVLFHFINNSVEVVLASGIFFKMPNDKDSLQAPPFILVAVSCLFGVFILNQIWKLANSGIRKITDGRMG